MHTLALLAVTFLPAAEAPADKAVREELKKLEGTWQCVPMEGFERDEDARKAAKKLKIVFAGDKYKVLSEGRVTEEGTLVIDPSKSPGTMDMKVTKSDGKGRVVECIYRWDDKDTFHLSTALPDYARPKTFDLGARGSSPTKWVRESAR
jgi:uncharacterized protein (TIGR03067 family)